MPRPREPDLRHPLRLLAGARRRAFEAVDARKDPQAIFRAIAVEQVSVLLEHSEELPRHPLLEEELLWDRFLLHYSRCYRRTREVAHAVGISLKPSLVSLERDVALWDFKTDPTPYSPLASELRWALSRSAGYEERFARLVELRRYVTQIYHALNHAIIHRLIQPRFVAGSRRERALDLVSWIETLVYFRESQLLQELGPVGVPITLCNSVTPGHEKEICVYPPSAEGYDRVRGVFYRAHRALARPDRGAGDPGVSDKWRRNDSQRRATDWAKDFVRDHRGRIPLPRSAARSTGLPVLRFPVLSPAGLAADPRARAREFSWFVEVFGEGSGTRPRP